MSAKLENALANRQVLIRKIVSGEVVIHFADSDIKSVILSHGGVMDLASRRGVTVDAIRNSNLNDLLKRRMVEIL